MRTPIAFLVAALSLVTLTNLAAPSDPPDPPRGPVWGRDTLRPSDLNAVFATSDGCAHCHGAEMNGQTLVAPGGLDATPVGTWQGSVMAHAFVDPYFRAQLAREVERDPERQAEIERFCVTCHAPMSHHTARLYGDPTPPVEDLQWEPLAADGVSCTVCHQVRPEGLGEPSTYNGKLDIRAGRRIYGPYADPNAMPMIGHSAYRPVGTSHLAKAELCASCHVLETSHHGGTFLEQATWMEWTNSIYADAETPESARTCQQCHMKKIDGVTPLRRSSIVYPLQVYIRPEATSHTAVGGNAFLLDMLARHADDLMLSAPPESLLRTASESRRMLAAETARISIENIRDEEEAVVFDVVVENLTGHKFPSGYPSRRAFLSVLITDPFGALFRSGGWSTGFGALERVDDPLRIPHYDRITKGDQVMVYEMVADDAEGEPTTVLSEMVRVRKDNRLLPKGWRADGPDADRTAPVGVDGDEDFIAGRDTVTYVFQRPPGGGGPFLIRAELLYQPIPPSWANGLVDSETEEAEQFLSMYYASDPAPEHVAGAVARIE